MCIPIKGRVIKSIGGFYDVKTEDNIVYTCKPRGVFRKKHISPYVGDYVEISHVEDETASLDVICERKNSLTRPPVANIDKLFVVSSVVDPAPNMLLIDKTIAIAEINNIEPILVLTKSDLADASEYLSIYETVGIKVIVTSVVDNLGVDEIKKEMSNSFSVFTGNSGVGKSSLINSICPSLVLETGETSKKLGRGKHTTRHVELYELSDNTFVADTPGFSTFEIEKYNLTDKDMVVNGFRELLKYTDDCKFTSCSHTCEKGCAVIEALNNSLIHKSRHDSYVSMYNEIKDIKQWQIQKNV